MTDTPPPDVPQVQIRFPRAISSHLDGPGMCRFLHCALCAWEHRR
jgi:hypothetical protein